METHDLDMLGLLEAHWRGNGHVFVLFCSEPMVFVQKCLLPQ